MKPLVSVVVAAYNIEEYLGRCLDSLVVQTLSDFEIVVVDDGSTDSTTDIARDYASRDERVVYLRKDNGGLPQARRTGYLASRGEYLCFVDGDDWFEPDYLLDLYEALSNTEATFSACDIYFEYEAVGARELHSQADVGTISASAAIEALHKRRSVFVYIWNKMFRRGSIERISFPLRHIVGEDYTVVAQVLEQAVSVSLVNKPLCHYSQREGTMSKRGYREEDLIAFENYSQIASRLVSEYPSYKDVISDFMTMERDMGALFLMARGDDRCAQLIDAARNNLRRALPGYLARSNDGFFYKVAACVARVSPGLFFMLHRQYKRICK